MDYPFRGMRATSRGVDSRRTIVVAPYLEWRGDLMRQIHAAMLAMFVVLGFVLAVQAQATYRAPRMPWGDPDLEGKWPSTRVNAVPLQRAESLGTRNTLTDAEFAERAAQL